MISRLRDHIERLDNGVVYAVDDISVVLRALMGDGPGNDVLGRLYRLSTLEIEIQLSRPPAPDSAYFSVGSVPTFCAESSMDGASWVPLQAWPGKPVLRMSVTSKKISLSWKKFLEQYSNKWGGAHLDKEAPVALKAIDLYEAGGLQLSAYLLRSAAVQVWMIGQELIANILAYDKGGAKEHGARVTPPGGLADAPTDRRKFGELMYLNYSDRSTEKRDPYTHMIVYYSPEEGVNLRICAGGSLTYDLSVKAAKQGAMAAQTQRARDPISPESVTVSEGGSMMLTGKFRAFSDLDPETTLGSETAKHG